MGLSLVSTTTPATAKSNGCVWMETVRAVWEALPLAKGAVEFIETVEPTQIEGQISPEAVAPFERYFDHVLMPMVRAVFESLFEDVEDGYEPSFEGLTVSYGPTLGAFINCFDKCAVR
jgi:hypothetical protein